jgi:hypothetical protein
MNWRTSCPIVLSAALLTGCGIFKKDPDAHFSQARNVTQIKVVDAGGDFALYLDHQDKPEVPVRVDAGDWVGFFRDNEGRVKGLAGPFRIDIAPEVQEATWKRLNYADE